MNLQKKLKYESLNNALLKYIHILETSYAALKRAIYQIFRFVRYDIMFNKLQTFFFEEESYTNFKELNIF